jgi:hypothetical protein
MPANNGCEADGSVCLYRLACEVDDHVRQTGKNKRIVKLPDLRMNTGILIAFLLPQQLTTAMHNDLISKVDLIQYRWNSYFDRRARELIVFSLPYNLLTPTD